MIKPMEWTPELVSNGREGDLFCIVRWAVDGSDRLGRTAPSVPGKLLSADPELFLCGPLEVWPHLSHVSYRDAESLGFSRQGEGGYLALFEGGQQAFDFIEQGSGPLGPGIAQNHPLALKALRFDVKSFRHYDGSTVWWGRDMLYFEALTQLARARMFAGSTPRSKVIDMELAESVRRKWTLSELVHAMRAHRLEPGLKGLLNGEQA